MLMAPGKDGGAILEGVGSAWGKGLGRKQHLLDGGVGDRAGRGSDCSANLIKSLAAQGHLWNRRCPLEEFHRHGKA